MTKEEFCSVYKFNEEQFYGKFRFGSVDLSTLKIIPKGFNPAIYGNLFLNEIEYWLKWFKPFIDGKIYLDKLKSPTLKKLIENSKTRKLGYNLLNNI